MIKFREHSGSFKESMKTIKEFDNGSELIDYLRGKFKVQDIKSELYSTNNVPADWDKIYIVTIHPGPGVLGFTDKLITIEPKEMDNWIKCLEENAIKEGRDRDKGYLFEEIEYSDDARIDYFPEDKDIDLNGTFTIPQMESLLNHIKKYNKEGS